MLVRLGQTVIALCLTFWTLLGAGVAVSAKGPPPTALFPSASLSMPTYAGPSGARVPLGACIAVRNTRVWILPCSAPQGTIQQRNVWTHPRTGRWARGERRALVLSAAGLWTVLLIAVLTFRPRLRAFLRRAGWGSGQRPEVSVRRSAGGPPAEPPSATDPTERTFDA